MPKHKIKFTTDDDEVRSQKSHYTNVSKISSKHVELSLEVEMDDEVRDIIKCPDKCTSALLDVTIIKPKGFDNYTKETQILKTNQVKSMIAAMKLNKNDKEILMNKLFGKAAYNQINEKGDEEDKAAARKYGKRKCFRNSHNFRQSSLKLEQGDVHCVTDETNSAVYSMYNKKPTPRSGVKTQQQQIFTTPKTYENIRTMFACTNKNNQHNYNEKLEQPCVCQNCAIVGILSDSQKVPFATEPMPDPMELKESKTRRPVRKKSVSFKQIDDLPSTSRSHEQCQAVFKLLSARIRELEKRVAIQEEKAVPKEYFKKIITKLVNHLTKLTHYTTEERKEAFTQRNKDPQPYSKYKPSDKYNRYYVNPVLVENTYKVPAEKEYEPKPCSSGEPPKSPSDSIWKWGEDFLTSGRDLKNKVVVLLEETLHNLKKGWEKSEAPDRFEEAIQNVVEELTKEFPNNGRAKAPETRTLEQAHLQSGKKMTLGVSDGARSKIPMPNSDRKFGKPSLIPRFMRKKGPTVNVAYVNPKLESWPEESSVSFKIDLSDYESQKENMSDAKKKPYKKEFLKVLDKTKTGDKFKLWQNIWNQALENRQTKNDIVTIQIPDPKDMIRQKMIHIEYTIGELEQLLTDARNCEEKKK